MKITKAVIAVAGYGTRFLPATKNQPKEMLPIIDKPIVQYLVEEAVESGIEDIILVTRVGQTSLENHFDTNMELEMQLKKANKMDRLEKVQKIYKMANYIYIRQGRHLPYGNGTPLLCVKNLIRENEPFIYMFGDDLVLHENGRPCVKQLVDVYAEQEPDAMLGVQEVPEDEVERYGTVRYKQGTDKNQIEEILEKLPADQAPSRMAQFGRFVLTPKVINILKRFYEEEEFGKDGELWLTDALNKLAKTDTVLAQPIKGKWMTTGDPLRFMKASVEYALVRDDIGPEFKNYLKELDL
jgi:UTP--glucose-1-phosphate uridylyltransferase